MSAILGLAVLGAVLGGAVLAEGSLPPVACNGVWRSAKFAAQNHATGGPLLGNADLSAVVQTSPSADTASTLPSLRPVPCKAVINLNTRV